MPNVKLELKLEGFTDDDVKAVYVPYYLTETAGGGIETLGRLNSNTLGTGLPRSSRWPIVSTSLTLIYYLSQEANKGVLLVRPLAIDDTDSIIHAYHLDLMGNREKKEVAA